MEEYSRCVSCSSTAVLGHQSRKHPAEGRIYPTGFWRVKTPSWRSVSMAASLRHGVRSRKLEGHILNSKQEAEREPDMGRLSTPRAAPQ